MPQMAPAVKALLPIAPIIVRPSACRALIGRGVIIIAASAVDINDALIPQAM